MERKKTISKHFYDDEILYKNQETGDIHLKMGVRKNPNLSTEFKEVEDEYFNYDAMRVLKHKEFMKKYSDIDPHDGEVDNWETE